MTDGANWDCGEGRVGLSQTGSDKSDGGGKEGRGGDGDYKYFRSISSVQ